MVLSSRPYSDRIEMARKQRRESCGSLRLEQEGVEPLRDQGAHSLRVALLCRLSLA
jgi:hypothetical protein